MIKIMKVPPDCPAEIPFRTTQKLDGVARRNKIHGLNSITVTSVDNKN